MIDDPARSGVTPEQLATLSHEFRTPLNGVLGMARLLDSTRLTAEQRAYVNALKESGEHLLALVNDVLDLARLGAGKIEIVPAPTDVESLLRQVCELMSPRAHEKGIEVAWAASPRLPMIRADESRLRQILLNFAGNAVKFTEEGGVLIAADWSCGRLRFSVSDTGPGVPEKARHRIFEPFVHADPSHGAVMGGAGLGLAIVRRLSQAMGGEIGLEPTESGGACFWFEAAFETVGVAPRDRSLDGLTVGVASPNPIVRQAAARQIEACGGRAFAAPDAVQLAALAPSEAVLLIDHALAHDRKTVSPPAGRKAIVLLRPSERDLMDRYRNAGFAGYLIKPLRRASVSARVLAALEAEQGAPTDDERIAPTAAVGARVLLAEDNPINALLARTLLEREGCRVDQVGSGEEALAATEAARYDLILMDVRMPGIDGLDAVRILRGRGLITPIVALTADAFEDDRRACIAAGMQDVLVKPLHPDGLRGILSRWASGVWTQPPGQAKVAS